ncbi:MAG: HNH endonuclease [Cellulosilyticaceae bacterium]
MDREQLRQDMIGALTQKEMAIKYHTTQANISYHTRQMVLSEEEKYKCKINKIKRKFKTSNQRRALAHYNIKHIHDLYHQYYQIKPVVANLREAGIRITNDEVVWVLEHLFKEQKVCIICGQMFSVRRARNYCQDPKCVRTVHLERERKRQKELNSGPNRGSLQYISVRDVAAKQGDKCYLCGEQFDWRIQEINHPWRAEKEHFLSRYYGGADTEDNIRAACRCCNIYKNNSIYGVRNKQDYLQYRQEALEKFKDKTPVYPKTYYIDDRKFEELYLSGASMREIEDRLGISSWLVYKKREQLKLPKRVGEKANYKSNQVIRLLKSASKRALYNPEIKKYIDEVEDRLQDLINQDNDIFL